MKRRAIAQTAVAVTELGFGAAPIGNLYEPVTDAAAEAAIDAAWACGIRYFDTAPHYGLGLSERRLGAALAHRPREDYVISTKVGRLLVDNPAPTGSDLANGFAVSDTVTRRLDYSADGARRSLDASLERLGLDRVDIVFVHDPVDHLDMVIRETIPALIRLREEGVIGAVGVGMNLWEPLRRAVVETDIDVVMVAGRWTLLDRSAAPLLEACDDNGCSVLAAAPFNSGLLARDVPEATSYFDYGPASSEIVARATALARVCEAGGARLPQAALQFPLRHPGVAGVVAGMATAQQATEDAALIGAPVPDAVWDLIATLVAG